jgi:hypothetical protein
LTEDFDIEELEQRQRERKDLLAARAAAGDVTGEIELRRVVDDVDMLILELHDAWRRLGENPCARCFHMKDAHGENPPRCYACSRVVLEPLLIAPEHCFDELLVAPPAPAE